MKTKPKSRWDGVIWRMETNLVSLILLLTIFCQMVNMKTGKMNLNQLASLGSAVAEAQAVITFADVIIHRHYKYFHKIRSN